MNNAEPLNRHVVARAARHLAATSFTHPGSAPARAVTLIDTVYTRAQMRADAATAAKPTPQSPDPATAVTSPTPGEHSRSEAAHQF